MAVHKPAMPAPIIEIFIIIIYPTNMRNTVEITTKMSMGCGLFAVSCVIYGMNLQGNNSKAPILLGGL